MPKLWTPSRRHFLGYSAAALGIGLVTRPSFAQSTPQHGGTLVVSQSNDPVALSGIAHTGVSGEASKALEGLLSYDFDLNPVPQLATDWSVSADGLTYTFKLRPGVKWHDGQPFTSADVAFSLNAIKEVHPRGRVTFAPLTEVQTPDEHTAVLKLSRVAPYLLTAFAAVETPIVPKHLYEGTNVAENPHNNAPVGTGPWVFKEWVRGSHVRYERNPDCWDAPKPYFDALIYQVIPDAAARSIAFETGEVHIGGGANVPIPVSDLARFEALEHIGFDRRGQGYINGVQRIEFNLEVPFFQDQRVRQAFAHTIDKSVIHQTVNFGYGSVIPGPIADTLTKFYEPGLKTYAIDTGKAESLLDAAGFPRGADGIRHRLTLDPLGGSDHHKRGSEYIKQALAGIGVEVSLRTQDFPTYIKRVYTDRDFEFSYHGMSNLFDPTVGVQRLYWSKNFKPGIPFTNGSKYESAAADGYLEAAAIEQDPAKRRQFFTDFQNQVIEDLPDINTVSTVAATVYNKRVVDHTTGALGLAGNFADAHFVS